MHSSGIVKAEDVEQRRCFDRGIRVELGKREIRRKPDAAYAQAASGTFGERASREPQDLTLTTSDGRKTSIMRNVARTASGAVGEVEDSAGLTWSLCGTV